jgi:prepilin-type processing-associated H-X9-DG protein
MRLCPDDFHRIERIYDTATSYAMNGYLRDAETADTSGLPPILAQEILASNKDFVRELYDLCATHATIVMFEKVASPIDFGDHVHSYRWFSETNLANRGTPHFAVYKAVEKEVALDRHVGEVANYLYADGHVGLITRQQVARWCDEGFNFALPIQ